MPGGSSGEKPSPTLCELRPQLRRVLGYVGLLLLALTTSPFTIGPGLVWAGAAVTPLLAALRAAISEHVVLSLFLAGAAGFGHTALVVGWLAQIDVFKRAVTARLLVLAASGFCAQVFVLNTFSGFTELTEQFSAAGGAPGWLNVVACVVLLLLCAQSLLFSLIICVPLTMDLVSNEAVVSLGPETET